MAEPLRIVLPIRFHEAIRAAERRRVSLPDTYYGDHQVGARSASFTISGLAGLQQISAALETLNEGLRQGMTFAEWKAKALAEGWMLTPAHLDLVLRAHTQTAYMRGQYEKALANKKSRPFLMYSAINDHRARPSHLAMGGIIRHIDDAFWDTHFPPCGFNCRCGVITLSEQQARDRGGPTATIPIEARADPGWGLRPSSSPAPLNDRVERRALDLPGPLQDEVKRWHETIKEERIAERVRAYVRGYSSMAADVRTFVRDMGGLVAEHEAVALRAYTGDQYVPMNRFLRGRDKELDLNLMATVSAAVSALAKLTPFEGTVYRGVFMSRVTRPAAFKKAHVPGEVVEYEAFTSASWGTESAFHGDVLYRIKSRSGRVVEEISEHGHEREVLFAPGTQFRVISVETRGNTLFLELEEITTRVAVPDSHKFEDAFDRAKRGENAGDPVPDALQERMASEAEGVDPEVMEQFKRSHDGMTPLEFALSRFPSAALEVEQAFSHLLPKKPV